MSQQTSLSRACEYCRHRKIRCDRTFPCSGCRAAGVHCTASKNLDRPKQARVLISSQYERKIDLIEERLDRLGDFVEKLTTQLSTSNSGPSVPEGLPVALSTPSQVTIGGPVVEPHLVKVEPGPECGTNRVEVLKGQSSLSAHSSFAVDFLQKAVGTEQGNASESEFRALLDTLSPIVGAFTSQPVRPTPLFPFARSGLNGNSQGIEMPPIQTAVALLRLAEGEGNIDLQWTSHFFTRFLPSQTLSDLCLKIYFSQDYSIAELILTNVALYFFGGCIQTNNHSPGNMDANYETLMSTCRANIETSLSQLSLYTEPNYEMILALTLCALYALDSPRNSLACALVRVASHTARTLEYHTRSVGTEASGEVNNKGHLFWIVYYLEKMLSLRNGQSSTMVDAEITLPLPGDGPSYPPHFMSCMRNSLKIAGLAGRIYSELYSADSLSLPVAVRAQRSAKLSQELEELSKEARTVNELWAKSTSCPNTQNTIRSTLMSDEVNRLSMATLIHRAMPVQGRSASTFTGHCVLSARAALESHQQFILEYGMSDSVLLTMHITWSILFVPFVPFIVLFCHSIETGDVEDLNSMQKFVTSIQSACAHSPAIERHHRLFQVFCNVAMRYCELKAKAWMLQPENLGLRRELDAQLSTIGLYPPQNPCLPLWNGGANVFTSDCSDPGASVPGLQADASRVAGGDGSNLGDWFTFSQNMMGLLENNNI
ncbi:hypothetical protein BJY01DRAFT_223918 [Aspergillus pseudoustus]|uniref:Zn(2)-C6 fungal-type domain-containing protein n=1 Tax=Aspergillus pseudoustus TaxID=1810923 RepID=A0ABR4J4D1_9EURO